MDTKQESIQLTMFYNFTLFFSLLGAYLLQFMTAPTSPHYFRAGPEKDIRVSFAHSQLHHPVLLHNVPELWLSDKLTLSRVSPIPKDIDSVTLWKQCQKVI